MMHIWNESGAGARASAYPGLPNLPPSVTVERRVNVAPALAVCILEDPAMVRALRHLDLGAAGWLELGGGPATPGLPAPPLWRGRGRLHPRGAHVVRFARVEVELSAWSSEACHLYVRPASRHALQWGGRRRRRYFDLAHLAADHLWLTVTAAARQPEPCSSLPEPPEVAPKLAA